MKRILIFFIPLLFFIPLFLLSNMTIAFDNPSIDLKIVSDISNNITTRFMNTALNQTTILEEPDSVTSMANDTSYPVINHPHHATSQFKILESDLYDAEFKLEKIKNEIATLGEQKLTLEGETQVYLTDLQNNYLIKLTEIKNSIAKQPLSESHPQIKNNGMIAIDQMIQMIMAFIENPTSETYKTLGESAQLNIKEAFVNVNMDNTFDIVKYLTTAGNGQTTIGLKLKDAKSIATKFLEEYGQDGSPKGEAYKINKRQQEATVNVIEIQNQELDNIALEISGIKNQLSEIIQ
ncbi:MAG: hypothetical protein ACRCST_03705 [Turicibacter sp.]